jgi:catechol 2,3-dioxygenase-like lactoylglutathione lyase family enzyme
MSQRRPDVLAVHSVDQILVTLPDLESATKFYTAFGLDVRPSEDGLDIYSFGHAHCWMKIVANQKPKKLQFISFGIYKEDEAAFKARIASLGIGCAPHPMATREGLWLKGADGVTYQLVVADKVSPSSKTPHTGKPGPTRGTAMAPARSTVSKIYPRWLSHTLLFTPDVIGFVKFCTDVLGLRLSDKSVDLVAFMHTPHGSDHHLLACVKSEGPGLHHTSWDVGSLDDVGRGSEQLRDAGYPDGWGVGRHVLGSNYFYYARDPWGSFAEYSFDIDFVPALPDWQAGEYAPEDSFYLWGPAVPDWFVINQEHLTKAA